MKVTLEWTEAVRYRSEIDVDENDLRAWMQLAPDDEITAQHVREYLNAGYESEWFERCDTNADFYCVDDRALEGVEL